MAEFRPNIEPSEDEYDFLTHEQWDRVLALMSRDMRGSYHGVSLCAPEYPEAGQESQVTVSFSSAYMNWTGDGLDQPLSSVILHGPGGGIRDEIERTRDSLASTMKVLDAALARMP